MTLPDVLEALAVRLPERFSLSEGRAGGTVKLLGRDDEADEWINLGWWPKAEGGCVVHDRDLRALLEQECEARGWGISQKIWNDGSGITTVNVFVPGCPYLPSGKGDTPALALCLAFLSALEAQ